jgi:maltose alpha-D-glucosyltransferase/alpha-amylase
MFGRTRFPSIGELPYLLTLAPRGFFWFLLREDTDADTDAGADLEATDANA